MTTLVDLSATPQINRSSLLPKVITPLGPVPGCVSLLTTGTFTGTPKLEISLDGTNFYPATNEDGDQIELEAEKIIFLNYPRVHIRVDLTGVTSSDLKVTIQ